MKRENFRILERETFNGDWKSITYIVQSKQFFFFWMTPESVPYYMGTNSNRRSTLKEAEELIRLTLELYAKAATKYVKTKVVG